MLHWPNFTCGFADPAVERARKEWFIHDPDGNICSATAGNPGNRLDILTEIGGDLATLGRIYVATCLAAESGRVLGSISMDWQHAAPGAVEYWGEVIGGWLAENLSPAAAVFLDVVDGLGCQPNVTTHSW